MPRIEIFFTHVSLKIFLCKLFYHIGAGYGFETCLEDIYVSWWCVSCDNLNTAHISFSMSLNRALCLCTYDKYQRLSKLL
jgi:hypothetical protein